MQGTGNTTEGRNKAGLAILLGGIADEANLGDGKIEGKEAT